MAPYGAANRRLTKEGPETGAFRNAESGIAGSARVTRVPDLDALAE
jgi:hypothetical protein